MFIRSFEVLDTITEKVNDIEIRLDEIRNLMPDDLSYKTLRLLAKDIIEIARELKAL